LLRTHPRIAGVNRALGNGARLHNWNDIDLVLNLIDFTVGDAPHHFREEPHRVYVRRATSIFRDRPAEGFLQKLFGFQGQSRAYFREYFSATVRSRIHCASVNARIASAISSLDLTDTSAFKRLLLPPSSLYADSGISLGHRP
jgi:hypothetical protein